MDWFEFWDAETEWDERFDDDKYPEDDDERAD